jgi:hypothetical protein
LAEEQRTDEDWTAYIDAARLVATGTLESAVLGGLKLGPDVYFPNRRSFIVNKFDVQ